MLKIGRNFKKSWSCGGLKIEAVPTVCRVSEYHFQSNSHAAILILQITDVLFLTSTGGFVSGGRKKRPWQPPLLGLLPPAPAGHWSSDPRTRHLFCPFSGYVNVTASQAGTTCGLSS